MIEILHRYTRAVMATGDSIRDAVSSGANLREANLSWADLSWANLMPERNAPQPCEHKWVHLRHVGATEVGYRQWANVDQFYCERCLAQQTVETPIPEKRSYGAF